MSERVLIAVLKRVADKVRSGLPVSDALDMIADELESGVDAHAHGKTKRLTLAQLNEGRFMGDPAEDVTRLIDPKDYG